MKLINKIYLATLLLFLCILSFCFLMFANSVYKKNVEDARENAIQSQRWMLKDIKEEFDALKERQILTDELAYSVMDSFSHIYNKKNIFFGLIKEETLLYYSFPYQDILKEQKKDSEGIVSYISYYGKQCYLVVSDNTERIADQYQLLYAERLISLEELLQTLMLQTISISLAGTLMLGIVLFILLKRLLNPLERLTKATNFIADGSYDEAVPVSGNDEITILSRKFNLMTQEIKNKVDDLAAEAEKKQIFIDNLAHELKTPLTAIQGYAQYLLLAKPAADKKNTALEYMVSESNRLAGLSKNLGMLTQIRAGEFEKKKIPFEELFRSICLELKFMTDEKKITITEDIKLDYLYGDAILFHSLLRNVTENAIRACEEDGKVSLTAYQRKEQAIIEIRDNGIGMEEEELSYLTEPFYRVDKVRSRSNGGCGLGLALCNDILKVYEGNMECQSQKGKGTAITLSFYNLFTTF